MPDKPDVIGSSPALGTIVQIAEWTLNRKLSILPKGKLKKLSASLSAIRK